MSNKSQKNNYHELITTDKTIVLLPSKYGPAEFFEYKDEPFEDMDEEMNFIEPTIRSFHMPNAGWVCLSICAATVFVTMYNPVLAFLMQLGLAIYCLAQAAGKLPERLSPEYIRRLSTFWSIADSM